MYEILTIQELKEQIKGKAVNISFGSPVFGMQLVLKEVTPYIEPRSENSYRMIVETGNAHFEIADAKISKLGNSYYLDDTNHHEMIHMEISGESYESRSFLN